MLQYYSSNNFFKFLVKICDTKAVTAAIDLVSQPCTRLLLDALTGTSDNKFLTSEECNCLTSISLKEFEAASQTDPQSCGFNTYHTVADEVAQCIGKLG